MSNNANTKNRKRNSIMATVFFTLALLQLLLILLRASGKITCAWFIVLIPAELVLLVAAVSLLVIIGCLVYALVKKIKSGKSEKSADGKPEKKH